MPSVIISGGKSVLVLSAYKIGIIFILSAIVGAAIAIALLFVQNGFQFVDRSRRIWVHIGRGSNAGDRDVPHVG